MDQVRPQNPKRRRTDDRAPEMGRPAPHQTPSGGGPAPTPDRSETPAAGSALIGIDNQRPVTEGILSPARSDLANLGSPAYYLMSAPSAAWRACRAAVA